MEWTVYVLRCGDGSLYTGITTDLERRVREHRAGVGGRFTRAHLPVEVVYRERLASEGRAKRREAQLKLCPRQKKLALVIGAAR